MKILKLILITLLLLGTSHADSYLPWSSPNGLSLSDFPTTVPADAPANFAARTFADILWDVTSWDDQTKTLVVKAQAAFNQTLSWVRPEQMGNTNLEIHERGHFNLAEVFAREFKKALFESDELKKLLRECNVTKEEIEAFIIPIHATYSANYRAENDVYEGVTENGDYLFEQANYTNNLIPSDLANSGIYAPAEVTISIDPNLGPVPRIGNYKGQLSYQLVSDNSEIAPPSFNGIWKWDIAGEWNYRFINNGSGGNTELNHHYTNNLYSGLLVSATTPSVPSTGPIPVIVKEKPAGDEFWIRPGGGHRPPMDMSHILTFDPHIPSGLNLPINPPQREQGFPNTGYVALGHWMKNFGTVVPLEMLAPITCPGESIEYELFMGPGKLFTINWTLIRED